MKIERFEDIEAWKLARQLAGRIYDVTDAGQFARDFGLRDQIRRAVGSVMHNIAEGFDAGGNAEFVRFLQYAKRSCTEIQSELYVALDRRYLTQPDFDQLYEAARLTRAKIGAFIQYLERYGPKPRTVNREPRTLFIDADDTLWENNIYFERVTGEFVAALNQRGLAPHRIHETLWETEMRNVKITGYGSKAFCRSLHEVARNLGATDMEPQIRQWEDFIFHHPIQLMPGVRETLPVLYTHNRTILLTKGRDDEQLGKLHRSGLAPYFHEIEVVFEKNVATYQSLITKHRLQPSSTWMIGNSPRSDINPAKAAGLHTVFIPYHTTWQHEIEEISPSGGETLMLETFAELREHFGVRVA